MTRKLWEKHPQRIETTIDREHDSPLEELDSDDTFRILEFKQFSRSS